MVRVVQHSWLGGQLDVEMMGRQDIDKYRKGATLLKNFLPIKRGAIRKRPGTKFVKDVTSIVGSKFRMVPFSYLSNNGFAIIFANESAYVVNASGNQYAVTGSVPYEADDLDDLHYVQCGDVMYLAHADYPPACIKHTESTTFVYSVLDVNPAHDRTPIISSAQVTRLRVAKSYRGAIKVEEYKVSAVRDGVETIPSETYKVDNATAEKYPPSSSSSESEAETSFRDTFDGTGYYLPWTDSQKITLTIDPNNGTLGNPEQIRVYKNSGISFGLIGVLSPTSQAVDTTPTESAAEIFAKTSAKLYSTDKPDGLGCGYGGWYGNSGVFQFSFATAISFSKVVIHPGCVYANYTTASSTCSAYKATYIPGITTTARAVVYYRCGSGASWTRAGSVEILGGECLYKTSSTSMSLTAAKKQVLEWSEGLNVTSELALYIDRVTGVTSVKIQIEDDSGTVQTGTIIPSGDNVTITDNPCALNNVCLYDSDGTIETTFTDDNITPDNSVTPMTEDVVMAGEDDYPATVAVYQQRLVWASSNNDPARIWMSQIGDFNVYCPHEIQTADDSIDIKLPITRFAKLNHIVEMRALLAFSQACEWVIGSNSSSSGISSETFDAKPHSYLGSDGRLPPIICNNTIVFAERTGEAVRRYGYQLADDGYGGRDISIFSSSIFNEKRIVDWTYQQFPNPTIWAVLSDGTLASLLFYEDTEQGICAWATHEVGGSGEVKAVAQTHALCGNGEEVSDTSEVLMIVKRGSTYSLEVMKPFPKQAGDTVENMVTMDCVRSIASGGTIPSGMTAVSKSTGAVVTTVGSDGVWAGYTYTADMVSVFPAISEQDIGAGQFDVKNVRSVALRVVNTVGGKTSAYGSGSGWSVVTSGTPIVDASTNKILTPMKDVRILLYGNNSRDGRVEIQHTQPMPMMLLSMESEVAVEIEGMQR